LEKGDFEIDFISKYHEEELFHEYQRTIAWLAIPYDTTEKFWFEFKIDGLPTLALMEKYGIVVTKEGVDLIEVYGVATYPFTAERFDRLRAERVAEEEALRDAHKIESLLVSKE
jgi:hypothetical protein